jgi:hypothetical protein
MMLTLILGHEDVEVVELAEKELLTRVLSRPLLLALG